MRLTADDIPDLPLAGALFDNDGNPVGQTPEWPGFAPGAMTYATGFGTLVAIPQGCNADLDEVVYRLIGEVTSLAATLPRESRLLVEMLAAGLTLVAGRSPTATARGPLDSVLEYAAEGVRKTVPGVELATVNEAGAATVPTPAALALGLVQLVRNAAEHAGATRVTLRATAGPTLRVEWRDASRGAAATTRRSELRRRWGFGYARLLADSLGGVVTAPAAVTPGIVASSIGLGAPRLSLPLAAVVDGGIERATRAWDEETGQEPGAAAGAQVLRAVDAGLAAPGALTFTDVFSARAVPGRTWVAVAPQSSLNRARDVLRGLQHEDALLAAPEPHATRIHALTAILATAAYDEPWEAVSAAVWERDFAVACAALGVPPVEVDGRRLRYPDPRLAAYLLSALEAELTSEPATGDDPMAEPTLVLKVKRPRRDDPLARVLRGADGRVRLSA